MVLFLPRRESGTQPLGPLLAGLASFVAGFEDDPDQPQVPHLLRGIRYAQDSELVALPAPAPCPFRFCDEIDYFTNRMKGHGGYSLSRHDPFEKKERGRWRWCATRYDDDGREWHTSGAAVVDDFGNLVEVRE